MPATAPTHIGMTWLLSSNKPGTPTPNRVGRAGLADMAEERPPSAVGR